MAVQDVKIAVLSDNIDLDGLESLLQYLAIGFTANTEFRILKSSGRAAKVPKSEADQLKSQFIRMFGGKPKSYLRARIPLLVIGLAVFSDDRARGNSLRDRLSAFKGLIQNVDTENLSGEDLRHLRTLIRDGLNRPYYTQSLNNSLDPIAAFFDGQIPGSFSNAVQELTRLLESQSVREVPTITVVEGGDLSATLDYWKRKNPYSHAWMNSPDINIINVPEDARLPRLQSV